jgi:hypothetical protein
VQEQVLADAYIKSPGMLFTVGGLPSGFLFMLFGSNNLVFWQTYAALFSPL